MQNTRSKSTMPLWAIVLSAASFLVAPGLAVLAFVCVVHPPLAAFLSSNTLWVLGVLAGLLFVVGVASIPALALGSEVTRLSASVRRMAEQGGAAGRRLPPLRNLGALVEDLRALLDRGDAPEQGHLDLYASNRILARQVERVSQLLDSTNDGLILIDTMEQVLFANRASKPFLGVDPLEAVGQPVRQCLRPKEALALLETQGESGSVHGVRSAELPADEEAGWGHEIVFQSHGFSPEEESVGQILVFRDMSRLKAMESLQAEFVDSVAHEFRTPLTSIRAYVEMLIDGETTDPQMQYDFYNVIYEETYRLSELIDNLLNISMMESGVAQLDITPTRIKRLLEDSVEVIRGQCDKKQIELVVDLPDRLPALDIDKRLFSMAVMNILGNAVKYTPEKGTVTLSTSSHEDEFQIHIRDTGIGISEEDLPRVFEKFYRAAAAAEIQGSGVGLATAAEIIRSHGGEIRVESTLGEGSRFTIALSRSLINTTIGE